MDTFNNKKVEIFRMHLASVDLKPNDPEKSLEATNHHGHHSSAMTRASVIYVSKQLS